MTLTVPDDATKEEALVEEPEEDEETAEEISAESAADGQDVSEDDEETAPLDQDSDEAGEDELDPDEVELHGDREAARARVRHVPQAMRRVTDRISNDCRGLPKGVIE